MIQLRHIIAVIWLVSTSLCLPVSLQAQETIAQQTEEVDVKDVVFGHIGDSYEWHITNIGKTVIRIPLPVIVYSSQSGWHAFLFSRLEENGGKYEGFYIAPAGSKYEGKIV